MLENRAKKVLNDDLQAILPSWLKFWIIILVARFDDM